MTTTAAPDWLARLRRRYGELAAPVRTAPDPVNVPMIRRWCEAMGERNPLYLDEAYARASPHGGLVAPPAMLEVWTMQRFRPDAELARPLMGLDDMDSAGFTAVVATDLAQEYLRYLKPGDLVTQRVYLEEVSDEKRTALGAGHFLDYRYEFTDQHGTLVGRMQFRILKFRPLPVTDAIAGAPEARAAHPHPRPAITRDSEFFWEGLKRQQILIRSCRDCGHLHHPPGPMCPKCHSYAWLARPMSGRGTVHSYVVVHQPQLPGFSYPLPVALVQLEEGVRLVGNLRGVAAAEVHIGMAVEAEFVEVEPGYALYAFRPAGTA